MEEYCWVDGGSSIWGSIVVSICVILHKGKTFIATKKTKLMWLIAPSWRVVATCLVERSRSYWETMYLEDVVPWWQNDPCYSYSEDIEERTTRIDVSSVLVEKMINYCGGKLRSRWKLYHKWDWIQYPLLLDNRVLLCRWIIYHPGEILLCWYA